MHVRRTLLPPVRSFLVPYCPVPHQAILRQSLEWHVGLEDMDVRGGQRLQRLPPCPLDGWIDAHQTRPLPAGKGIQYATNTYKHLAEEIGVASRDG